MLGEIEQALERDRLKAVTRRRVDAQIAGASTGVPVKPVDLVLVEEGYSTIARDNSERQLEYEKWIHLWYVSRIIQ